MSSDAEIIDSVYSFGLFPLSPRFSGFRLFVRLGLSYIRLSFQHWTILANPMWNHNVQSSVEGLAGLCSLPTSLYCV